MTPEQVLDTADHLAQPTAPHLPTNQAWWRQSLAHGVPGIALLHIELAAAGLRPWQRAHDWLSAAASAPITVGTSTGLFYGAPAVAFALSAAAAVRSGAYRSALESLETRIAVDIQQRVKTAHARIAEGRLPVMAEFDTIRGLAGIGAYLLQRAPGSDALHAVLGYLVRLAEPLTDRGESLPGWWTPAGPTGRPDNEFPGGHGNAGMAHGIGGPLALLSLAALRGVTVPGHKEAITALCAWLDSWRIDTATGSRWPYMITRDELRNAPTHPRHSGARRRPSWCYGTAGLARAQQLAALATSDSARERMAGKALTGALTDPTQRDMITDTSLCHGYSGLALITARAAADTEGSEAAKLRAVLPELWAATQHDPVRNAPGLLEGVAGVALAAFTTTTGTLPATHWDSCLLIA